MGIQDRDYMHERHRPQTKRRSPNMASNPVKSVSGFGKSILFFVVTLSVGTLAIHKISPEKAPINWTRFLPVLAKTISMPATGDVTLYQRGHSAAAVASFAVVASSSGLNRTSHLVKLVDVNTGQPVLSVFVRSGETASIKVPLGSYKANIASGEKWYGDIKLFGNETALQQGKAALHFYKDGNAVTGHTLTLAGTINGNFPTRQLSTDAF
jgi:hypothetical protein